MTCMLASRQWDALDAHTPLHRRIFIFISSWRFLATLHFHFHFHHSHFNFFTYQINLLSDCRVPSKALFTVKHLTVLGSFPNCSFKASRQKGEKGKIINWLIEFSTRADGLNYPICICIFLLAKMASIQPRMGLSKLANFFLPRRFERAIRKRTKHGQVLGREKYFVLSM